MVARTKKSDNVPPYPMDKRRDTHAAYPGACSMATLVSLSTQPECVQGEPLFTDERQRTSTRDPITHVVKSWTMLFEPARLGLKTHDIRILDRDYQVGDFLLMQEYNWGAKRYTGREIKVEITYITCARRGPDVGSQRACAFSPTCLHPDYGVLSIQRVI